MPILEQFFSAQATAANRYLPSLGAEGGFGHTMLESYMFPGGEKKTPHNYNKRKKIFEEARDKSFHSFSRIMENQVIVANEKLGIIVVHKI